MPIILTSSFSYRISSSTSYHFNTTVKIPIYIINKIIVHLLRNIVCHTGSMLGTSGILRSSPGTSEMLGTPGNLGASPSSASWNIVGMVGRELPWWGKEKEQREMTVHHYFKTWRSVNTEHFKNLESFFKCNYKNHQALWWNWLSWGPPQERKTQSYLCCSG